MISLPTLDLDVLRTFVLAFDLGSFARAADRVGRSQSAVSSQLRRLEEQAGAALVRKAGRGLALTEAGERLLGYARRLLDLNDEALTVLRGSALDGWVRLGLPQDFAESGLPDVLGRFARAHPQVRIDVRVEKVRTLVAQTIAGDLDLTLAWGVPADAPHVVPVAEVPMIWIGRQDWPGADRRAPLPLIAFEPPCSFRDPAIGALDQAGIEWRLAFSSPSLSGLWAAAAAGLGITMRTRIGLPAGLVALDPARSGLPPLPDVPLMLVHAAPHRSATVSMLADIILSVVRERLAAI